MSLEDKFAIHEVIAQYSYTWDDKNAEGFAQLFTEDAVWEAFGSGKAVPDIHLESQQAIREWATEQHRGRLAHIRTRHFQSGMLFEELTANTAQSRTMVLITHQAPEDTAPRVTLAGEYQDQWCKTEDGWKFAHRILRR